MRKITMGLLLLNIIIFAYPSVYTGSGGLTVMSARTLPFANIGINLGIFYSREKYHNRIGSGYSYPVYHHYGIGKFGMNYGITDNLEMYAGGTFYGDYDEQNDESAAGPRGDMYIIGNKDVYGGVKFWIPVINDTTKMPLVWLIGGNIYGTTTIMRLDDDDSTYIRQFMPYFEHKYDIGADFLMDFEIKPILIHISAGYLKVGQSIDAPIYRSTPRTDAFIKSMYLHRYNLINWGFGVEVEAGPFVRVIPEVTGHHTDRLSSGSVAADTLIGTFGIRLITPVGVTFDIGGQMALNNFDFVPDWEWPNTGDLPEHPNYDSLSLFHPPKNYYSQTGQWRVFLNITSTNALIPPPKPPAKGTIIVEVKDKETEEPLVANLVFSDTTVAPTMTDSMGKSSITLTPGVYKFNVTKDGYRSVKVTVTLKKDAELSVPITLSKVYHPKGIFTGTVIDAQTKKPVAAKIYILELKNRPAIISDVETGVFKDTLPAGNFTVKVEAEGYVTQTFPIVIRDRDTFIKNIKIYQKLVEHKKITLKGIHFDSGKASIRPDSYPILDEAVQLLKANPDVKVEIAGHTDSVGRASYNLRLSEARANAVRDYLIQHGIEASRLFARGYGETMPIAPNTTRAGRAKNRRIEFIVIK